MMFVALRRGTVLRGAGGRSAEVGIVLGPTAVGFEVLHGWIGEAPDLERFVLAPADLTQGTWRVASEADAAVVRALFLAAAKDLGPESPAWVAGEGAPEPGSWLSPPIGVRWGACLVCGDDLPPRKPGPGRGRIYCPGECSVLGSTRKSKGSRIAGRRRRRSKPKAREPDVIVEVTSFDTPESS